MSVVTTHQLPKLIQFHIFATFVLHFRQFKVVLLHFFFFLKAHTNTYRDGHLPPYNHVISFWGKFAASGGLTKLEGHSVWHAANNIIHPLGVVSFTISSM